MIASVSGDGPVCFVWRRMPPSSAALCRSWQEAAAHDNGWAFDAELAVRCSR